MSDLTDRLQSQAPGETSLEINFALTLSRLIEDAKTDPAQLRHTIYQLARIKLREQFDRSDAREINRLVAALEIAIQGVEDFSQRAEVKTAVLPPPDSALAEAGPEACGAVPSGELEVMLAASGDTAPVPATSDPKQATNSAVFAEPQPNKRTRRPLAGMVQFLLVAAIMVAGGAIAHNWSRIWQSAGVIRAMMQTRTTTAEPLAQASEEASPSTKEPQPSASLASFPDPDFPVPTTFGVFAIDGDHLVELKALPGRAPDLRVAISAAITAVSEAHVTGTQPKFIVFRRDLVASAPDAVQLRIMAQVTRMPATDPSGKQVPQSLEGWVIRNIAVPYKVSPVKGRAEMILLKPDTENKLLSGGRYALVIKGQVFDVTLDAPVTDPEHCLQRFNATNGTFYAPCPVR